MRTTGPAAPAPASERNKRPILGVLRDLCVDAGAVLEIGSGIGEHALFFARHMPHVTWYPTEMPTRLPDLRARGRCCELGNLMAPGALDVCSADWPQRLFRYVVAINVLHIVGPQAVVCLLRGAGRVLIPGGLLLIYGPFRYAARTLEPSNARFDEALRRRDPNSGLREVGWLCAEAGQVGLELWEDRPMPANNRCLVWRKAP